MNRALLNKSGLPLILFINMFQFPIYQFYSEPYSLTFFQMANIDLREVICQLFQILVDFLKISQLNRFLKQRIMKFYLNPYNYQNIISLYNVLSKIQMSRMHMGDHSQARRLDESENNDFVKLTRYQLENAYFHLRKEFDFVKKFNDKLGNQLKALYNRFQLHPRPENAELYKALQGNPQLHKYINAFQPLLEAYEKKIQDFEHNFQNLNDQFILLDNNFERMLIENQQLRNSLNETNKQLLQVYAHGSNQKIHADFGQMILTQLNEKQKLLVEANTIMQRQSHKYKSENNRLVEQVKSLKDENEKLTGKIKNFEISTSQQQSQIKTLKESIFDLKMKNNNLELEKKKIDQAHQRAQSQLTKSIKQSDFYKQKYEDLKERISKNINWQPQNDQEKLIEQLRTQIQFLKAEQGPSNTNKKFDKLQRDYGQLLKEKNKINENLQSYKIKEQLLNEKIDKLASQLSTLKTEKIEQQNKVNILKRNQEQLIKTHKTEITKLKRQNQEKINQLEQRPHNTGQDQITELEKRLFESEQHLNETKLQLEKLKQQFGIKGDARKNQGANFKETERSLARLKEKLKMQQQIFREQFKLIEEQNKALKDEIQSLKQQKKDLIQLTNDLKRQLQKAKYQVSSLTQQKQSMIGQIRRVRNQYETTLRQKQKLFQTKIKQIKVLIDESERRKRAEREKIQQAARQHRKVVQEIKFTYQQRVRQLETQQIGNK